MIAFRNPIFDRDRSHFDISEPSNFQHVQSGFISGPSNFRHVTHQGPDKSVSAALNRDFQGNSAISGPSNFRHIAHGFNEQTMESAQLALPGSSVPMRKRVKEERGPVMNVNEL
jgi:hypothetical protein